MTRPGIPERVPTRLRPDPSRVIIKVFVPGDFVPEHDSRAAGVIRRILALDEQTVVATLAETMARFGGRHRDLEQTFAGHFDSVCHRLALDATPSAERRLLIGAYFTHEYSTEAAALCNPSMVAHPDQDGLAADQTRFVMSVRSVGEGHISSIGFRTGVFGPGRRLSVDVPGTPLTTGRPHPVPHSRSLFEGKLAESGGDDEISAYVVRHLPERFTAAQLEGQLATVHPDLIAGRATHRTAERARWIVACNRGVEFPHDMPISSRVLWPGGPSECNGMEDARFVSFVDDSGGAGYYATYTAFDGTDVAPQLLHTKDFRTFQISQLTGPAACGKGMALFPRRVGGRYLALSRGDGESTALTSSTDLIRWDTPRRLHSPRRSWELVQVGNCGSPVETSRGWLVLTHGVGPMRTYSIGAMLLDLNDPARVVGSLDEPLLAPDDSERDGYVPNVVYTCGGMRHQDTLVIPYGVGDTAIAFATVDIPGLLDRIVTGTPAEA